MRNELDIWLGLAAGLAMALFFAEKVFKAVPVVSSTAPGHEQIVGAVLPLVVLGTVGAITMLSTVGLVRRMRN